MKQDGTDAQTEAPKAEAPAEAKSTPPSDSIAGMIEKLKPQIERALPQHMTPERMARMTLTALRNNPKLQKADKYSLMGSIITAAQLGLEPNTPLQECFIIPYWNNKNKRYDAQFQFGYRGIIALAHRSGKYRSIYAHAVDQADEFSYNYGLHQDLTHVPADEPTGHTTHFYAVYHLDNGGYDFRVWSRDQVLEHAKHYSQSWDKDSGGFKKDSAWNTAFDSMACKTVLIDLLRYAPKSVEIEKALSSDSRSFTVNPDNPDMDVDVIEGEFELDGGEV